MVAPQAGVRSLLRQGRQQSDRYHYAKFRLVTTSREVIAASGDSSNFLSRLAGLKAEAVLGTASTFTWLNTHRLYRRIANSDFGADFLQEVDAFLVTAFDCFVGLSETMSVTLAHRTLASIVLPCNGLRFEIGSGPSQLHKHANSSLVAKSMTTGREVTAIEVLGSPVTESLWANAFVLHAKNEELFENFYLHEITGAPEKCSGYRDRVLAALGEIRDVDPSLAKSIEEEVRWLVPIGTAQDEHYFSFTSAMLKEVLFISLHQGADDLVEGIVHEYHHGALNYYMDTIRIFDVPDDAAYYSPWKTEPRPLSGLFHGLFVFSACLQHYMSTDTSGSSARSRYRLARAKDIYYKLVVGALQVPRQNLTREGALLADACDKVRGAALQHWPSFRDRVPEYVEEHARDWRARNPKLAFREG